MRRTRTERKTTSEENDEREKEKMRSRRGTS
jgi:hypothetical protein